MESNSDSCWVCDDAVCAVMTEISRKLISRIDSFILNDNFHSIQYFKAVSSSNFQN
jgi:hypothetical protein